MPDVNLLVYAYNSDAPRHRKARRWWEDALSGTDTVGLAWVVCLGFVRLMTSRRVLVSPISPREALDHVRSWMDRHQVLIVQPGPMHMDILQSFADSGTLASEVTTDAHIAALAIEHQAEVHSNDVDFSRFSGLQWRNPVA